MRLRGSTVGAGAAARTAPRATSSRRPAPPAPTVAARSGGLLRTDAFPRSAGEAEIGEAALTEEELIELAAAKAPLIRVRGRWHALRRSELEKALLFLERRREGSVV